MGWSIGYDSNWRRDIGYGVPATCDHPGCDKDIDRGLSYVCGGKPHGGDDGCGLFFCGAHLFYNEESAQVCERCLIDQPNFTPKPDHLDWVYWKLTDESWQEWREENQNEVQLMRYRLPKDYVPSYVESAEEAVE